MKKLLEQFLLEKSVFGTITLYQNLLNNCSDKCRSIIKNNKNYQSQVSVCTSTCKIHNLRNLLKALNAMKGSGVSDEILQTKIMYTTMRLEKEIKKLMLYRQNLKKRQTKIPVSMSLKPSPDRYDPRKIQ